MKTPEQIQALKQTSIIGCLANRGISPTSKSGEWLMYHSPLREDHTASFGVNTTTNTFNDLGNGDHGDIIQLVMKLEKISFVDACKFLEGFASEREIEFEVKNLFSFTCDTSESTTQDYELTAVKDLQHPALIKYVESRKITLHTAFSYLKEIHYKRSGRGYFGVGYKNDDGGYVSRNGVFPKPMNLGKSGIKTFTIPNNNTISVFEGMFDFLSIIEYCKRPPRCTVIILNSVSNLSKAMPQLRGATTIYSYLDNDDAGRNATQKMRDTGLNVSDQSNIYSVEGYNDFNEFLIKGTKPP